MYLMPFSYKIKKNCIFWIQGFHLLKLCLTNMKLFSYSFNITLGKFETCFMDPKPPKLDAIYMYFVQIFIRLIYTDQQLFVKTYTYSISYTQSPLFPNFLVVFSNIFFSTSFTYLFCLSGEVYLGRTRPQLQQTKSW